MGEQNNINGAGASGGEGQSNNAAVVDQKTQEARIQEMFDRNNQQLTQTILSAVASMNNGKERAEEDVSRVPTSGDDFISEINEEAEALGMDENGKKAMVSILGKFLGKNAPKIKEETKEEITKDLTHAEQKKAHNTAMLSAFPQMLDPNSPLYRQSKVEYNSLDAHILKSPRATRIAIEEAARKLGIKPLTMEDIRQRDSENENGHGGGNKEIDTGPTKEQLDFAANFQVNQDSYKKHLALVKKRHAL